MTDGTMNSIALSRIGFRASAVPTSTHMTPSHTKVDTIAPSNQDFRATLRGASSTGYMQRAAKATSMAVSPRTRSIMGRVTARVARPIPVTIGGCAVASRWGPAALRSRPGF